MWEALNSGLRARRRHRRIPAGNLMMLQRNIY